MLLLRLAVQEYSITAALRMAAIVAKVCVTETAVTVVACVSSAGVRHQEGFHHVFPGPCARPQLLFLCGLDTKTVEEDLPVMQHPTALRLFTVDHDARWTCGEHTGVAELGTVRITSFASAQDILQEGNIGYTVNCAAEMPMLLGTRGGLKLSLSDKPTEQLAPQALLAFPLLIRAFSEKTTILFYCHQGVNRSVGVAAFLLTFFLGRREIAQLLAKMRNPGYKDQITTQLSAVRMEKVD